MKKILIISLLLILSSCSGGSDFDKKAKCANYKEKIEKEAYNLNGNLKEIFYSKSRNSCIYIVEYSSFSGSMVIDYMSGEKLFDTLNQYCGKINGKIELGKTKDKEPFNKIYKEYEIENKDIIGTDKCGDKIKDKFEKGIKELKGE